MAQTIPPPFSLRHVLVCTNVRDPAKGKPSCGLNGAIAFRERLKHEVKARGLKRTVMVTQSGCLDLCPQTGCAVAIYPENEWLHSGTDEADAEALLARILEGVPDAT